MVFGSENENGTVNHGFFEKAKDGTLLIDGVSEIPLDTQAKILRVLIDQKFKRLNGLNEINVNVRIISTSSKNIREEVDQGNFREDLYHRLNVVPIFLPALKDRTEDIPDLLNYFAKKIAELNGIAETKLDTDFDLFYRYDWPGNVRELRNIIERILILGENDTKKILNIVKESFGNLNVNKSQGAMDFNLPLKKAREQWEKVYLSQQLKINDGNISKTSKAVGMERSALPRKLSSSGIKI